jgi:hypothetical protein
MAGYEARQIACQYDLMLICIVCYFSTINRQRTNRKPIGCMNQKLIFSGLFLLGSLLQSVYAQTIVEIRGDQFYLNGKPTYPGRSWNGNNIEGLLINSRMVQGIFDDLNPETGKEFAYPDTKKWDASRNTSEFVAAMPLWYSYGLNAFTLNMQGGSPYGYGNKKCLNPGFNPDGSLMAPYMNRLDRILKKADDLHMVVILGIFYFGQDQYLTDEQAVINATDNLVNWLFERNYRNVIIEIANETNTRGNYDHKILWPDRIHELIDRVKSRQKNGYRYLVSTSYEGRVVPTPNVVKASDFLLIHGNGAKQTGQIQTLIDATKKWMATGKCPLSSTKTIISTLTKTPATSRYLYKTMFPGATSIFGFPAKRITVRVTKAFR